MRSIFLRFWTKFAAAVAILLLFILGVPSALAHAILVRSFPADQSIVRSHSVKIVLDYDSRIDMRRCTIILTEADGRRVPLQMEASGKPYELTAAASGLANGHYSIHWQVLAGDGHITRGDFGFMVEIK